jgi:hypothetical protein
VAAGFVALQVRRFDDRVLCRGAPDDYRGVEGVVLGCRVVVTNTGNGRSVAAVVADRGPSNKLGEISLACARAIGVPVNEASPHPANSGGTESQN